MYIDIDIMTIPWHLQSIPVAPNRFNPRNTEDRISRRTWTENVTQSDRMAERVRKFEAIQKKYPHYSVNEILRIMRPL